MTHIEHLIQNDQRHNGATLGTFWYKHFVGMGQFYSMPTCDPNSQVILWIQSPSYVRTCDAQSMEAGEAWKAMYPHPLPVVLQQASFSSGDWESFQAAVNSEVLKFKSITRAARLAIGLVIAIEIMSIALTRSETIPAWSGMIISIPTWLIFFAFVFKLVTDNEKVDRELEVVCNRFQQDFAVRYSNQIFVQYQTLYTSCCKPKGARPTRWITISKNIQSGIQMGTQNYNNVTYINPHQGDPNIFVAQDGKSTLPIHQATAVVVSPQNEGPVIGRVV